MPELGADPHTAVLSGAGWPCVCPHLRQRSNRPKNRSTFSRVFPHGCFFFHSVFVWLFLSEVLVCFYQLFSDVFGVVVFVFSEVPCSLDGGGTSLFRGFGSSFVGATNQPAANGCGSKIGTPTGTLVNGKKD